MGRRKRCHACGQILPDDDTQSLLTRLWETGLPAQQIADALGMARVTIYKWKSGVKIPGPKSREKIRMILSSSLPAES